MIYNMLTLSTQLLLIGFFVGVIAHAFFPQGRSQIFLVELVLSVVGAFLGTAFEVLIRSLWSLPVVYHMVFQFAVPLAVSILTLVIYRVANSLKE